MSGIVDIARDPLVWRTPNFVMRPLGPEDTPEILALFGDPEVVEFMDIAPLANLDEAREVVDWARTRRAMGEGVRWSIRPAEDGPLIGTCGFNTLETDRGRRGEIAYDLARAHWGRGVMAEVLPPLVAFGFLDLALHRLEAFVTAGNARSARLLERHGFTCEGVRREHAYWKGRYWDQLVYSRLATSPDVSGPLLLADGD
jgi:ribosomal-protein-alanine N-acetyltransferase